MGGVYQDKRASVEDVEEYLGSVPEKYQRCRVRGHDPIPNNVVRVADVEGHPDVVYEVTLRCSHRCGVYYRELANAEGRVVWSSGPKYDRAPGYLSENGRILGAAKDRIRLETYVTRVGR